MAMFTAPYLLIAGGTTPDQRTKGAVAADIDIVKSALWPWAADHTYLNLTETRADPGRFWGPPAHDRLGRIKPIVDSTYRIRANHPVRPAAQPIGGGR